MYTPRNYSLPWQVMARPADVSKLGVYGQSLGRGWGYFYYMPLRDSIAEGANITVYLNIHSADGVQSYWYYGTGVNTDEFYAALNRTEFVWQEDPSVPELVYVGKKSWVVPAAIIGGLALLGGILYFGRRKKR